jgi:ribosome-binding factor A
MPRRIDRANGVLRQEISELLSRGVNDPRLQGIISITNVQISRDLRTARVYVSVMGDREAKLKAMEGVHSAADFLRRELGERLSFRYVPLLKFELDESIEKGDHLLQVMDRLNSDQDDT